MRRFKPHTIVWKTMTYKCSICNKTISILLQEGVEGPKRGKDCIPSPFSISCPDRCDGFFPMMHIDWHNDKVIQPREPINGEYVFIYDYKNLAALPIEMIDVSKGIIKHIGIDTIYII